MTKIEKLLTEWSTKNLITSDQVAAIKKYEDSKESSSWVMTSLLILGAVIIGIGVISVVAANWHLIFDEVKLGIDFLLLLTTAHFMLRFERENKSALYEGSLVFFQVLCFASIGLISQIYNTGGKFYQALFLWSLCTFFLSMQARRSFAPFLWISISMLALSIWVDEEVSGTRHAVMIATLVSALATFIVHRWSQNKATLTAFRVNLIIYSLAALITAEITELRNSIHYSTPEVSNWISGLTLFMFLFLLVGIWTSPNWKRIQKIFLTLSALGLAASFTLPIFLDYTSRIAFALCTLLTLGSFALYCASEHHRRLFQTFLVFVGIRFFILYIQALGGLATTGFGLIISGLILVGGAIWWSKNRNQIVAWTERKLG